MMTSLTFLAAALASSTSQIPLGNWKLTDAHCSNASYQPSPDEKAFRDAILTGETIDRYVLTTPTSGTYWVWFKTDPKAFCVGQAPLTVLYTGPNSVAFKYGKTTWQTHSTDPNVTIDCSENTDQPEEDYTFSMQGKQLVLSWDGGPACGTFNFYLDLDNAP